MTEYIDEVPPFLVAPWHREDVDEIDVYLGMRLGSHDEDELIGWLEDAVRDSRTVSELELAIRAIARRHRWRSDITRGIDAHACLRIGLSPIEDRV